MTDPSVPWVPRARWRFRRSLARMRLTLGCTLLLALSNVIMAVLSAGDQLAIARAMSTNIAHLAVDPLLVLVGSAFVDPDHGWIWVPLTLLLLGGLERKLGARAALTVAVGAHVVATLVSEGLLLIQIAWHVESKAQINVLDVGSSYLILGALAGCLVVGSWRLRAAALVVGLLIVPNLLVDLPDGNWSAVGHLSSLVLGASLAAGLSIAGARKRAALLGQAAALAAAAAAAAQRAALVTLGKPVSA